MDTPDWVNPSNTSAPAVSEANVDPSVTMSSTGASGYVPLCFCLSFCFVFSCLLSVVVLLLLLLFSSSLGYNNRSFENRKRTRGRRNEDRIEAKRSEANRW